MNESLYSQKYKIKHNIVQSCPVNSAFLFFDKWHLFPKSPVLK